MLDQRQEVVIVSSHKHFHIKGMCNLYCFVSALVVVLDRSYDREHSPISSPLYTCTSPHCRKRAPSVGNSFSPASRYDQYKHNLFFFLKQWSQTYSATMVSIEKTDMTLHRRFIRKPRKSRSHHFSVGGPGMS